MGELLKKLEMQSIKEMPANDFRKEEFYEFLRNAEASGLTLYYQGKLVAYSSNLVVSGSTNNDDAQTEWPITGEGIRILARILVYKSIVRDDTLAYAASMVCSLKMNGPRVWMSHKENKLKYFYSQKMDWDKKPSKFRQFQVCNSGGRYFEFQFPTDLGAFIQLVVHDQSLPGCRVVPTMETAERINLSSSGFETVKRRYLW